jgi:putative transposase
MGASAPAGPECRWRFVSFGHASLSPSVRQWIDVVWPAPGVVFEAHVPGSRWPGAAPARRDRRRNHIAVCGHGGRAREGACTCAVVRHGRAGRLCRWVPRSHDAPVATPVPEAGHTKNPVRRTPGGGGVGVRRTYKFRMRPTRRQHTALRQCLDAHRELYNAALQERRDAWGHSRTHISYGDQPVQLKDIRRVRADVAVWSFSSQQATLRRLNRAFNGFFRRVKAGGKPGYPRFKGVNRFNCVEWPRDGDGARWHPDTGSVYLQGVGHVKVIAHRQVLGVVKTIQIRRLGKHWSLILSCDDVPAAPLSATGRQVGIDVGIANFVTTSDGEHTDNPRWARTAAARLETAQQRLSRKKPGSRNRAKARRTVAARNRKVANQRRDFHHKLARKMVESYDLIAVEALPIANMVHRPKPRPDPDNPGGFLKNGSAAKTGLNRSISDAAWGQFVSILRAKAEDAGRTLIEVEPRHTSDGCEACGHAAKGNRVTQALFACQRCRHTAQADEHAARNILRAGLALHAADAA